MADTITVRSEGLLLDEILAERFGPVRTRTLKLVEATLAINPGLAAHVVLPLGTRFTLPDLPAATPAARVINLFADS
ncbi:Phage Tail Protein X [Fulvimarina manganoxydans]|uniref:Phage Tail Protein X n=1 Tax=Fulvimarina manganoxydans TaxID=937218 RepID=A0A1W2EJP2_9HYPH|nr:tail protein X [Fulvimarina manganoxydans]SMD09949.1 Phage Tail Protein X [Fulvimarina manganoxydans]